MITNDSKRKLTFITKGKTMEVECYICSPDWLRNKVLQLTTPL